jgi:hypothetical protein
MKAIRKLPDETWGDVIVRYATDMTINDSGVGPDAMLDEFEFLVAEKGFPEHDAAWDVCDGYGLLDHVRGSWDDGEELDEVAA